MSKIKFKVSARTARLIGRENIATSKGAIIELVKNSSDADSNVCVIYFDNKFAEIPQRLSQSDFEYLVNNNISSEFILSCYDKENNICSLKSNLDRGKKDLLKETLTNLVFLYIIDAGEGMTQNIIIDHWMTIGTDNKAQNVFTQSGKIKAGAKGIGRFALDKLGDVCQMITKFSTKVQKDIDENGVETKNVGYIWDVDWRDFEGPAKTIDKVEADLAGQQEMNFQAIVKDSCPVAEIGSIIKEFEFSSGTILKISKLRDNWIDYNVKQVFEDLQVLVPAEEIATFKMYVFSALQPAEFGLVEGSICDDYDYKLVARSDDKQNVFFKIFRNEYDLDLIDPNLFKRPAMKEFPFRKEDLRVGNWAGTKSFGQLIPGFKQVDEDNIFDKIGAFDFTFYFMKRAYSSPDLAKFNYRIFASNERKEWLNKYGGIKLFRDKFRVRPYGEVNNTAFDWLSLGSRKSKSPAAVSKPEGGYRVEPENIAGAINISRLENIDFEDKSSREGLQENKTFQVFKELIQAIISIFEEDRAALASEMLRFYDEKNSEIRDRAQAERLAQAILERRDKEKAEAKNSEQTNLEEIGLTEADNDDTTPTSDSKQYENSQLVILAELNREKAELIEKLEDEQKILRGLASTGIVIASFTHELGNLNDVVGARIDDLEYLIQEKSPKSDYIGVEAFLNPYEYLNTMRKQDAKLQNWLKFSLSGARKDKRKRKKVYLSSYFSSLEETWSTAFINREIKFEMNLNGNEELALRVFEIDLDSIFNNLMVNSIDAFLTHQEIIERKITINIISHQREISIDYFDNGPGLSADIDRPDKIFEALFTTKRNKHTGEEEGTGLGMWILSSIVADNDGTKKLLFPEKGFGLRISLPHKFLTT